MIVKENYDFTDWFQKRGLEKLPFQSERMNQVIQSLVTEELPTVLGAAPNSGKTLMSICMMDTLIKDNPNLRILVLAHGTTVLRSQYSKEIYKAKPDFTYCEITNKKELAGCDANVVVAIPQTLASIKNLPHFDMLVCDEAHEYFFTEGDDEGMVQGIIRKAGIKQQLLLSGTPSKFILREFPLISIPLEEVMDAGRVAPLTVIVASSNYTMNLNRFNANDEVSDEAVDEQTEEATTATLDDFLVILEKKLKSALKDFTAIEAGVSALTGWQFAVKKLKKTMIVAKTEKQARLIRKYFLNKGVDAALSIAKTDSGSDEITRFIEDKNCNVLIVLRRGILGFSLPEMINVVDMTFSRNINRLFQLLCRVVRLHPKRDTQKFFFKIAPRGLEQGYEVIMTATMCLSNKYYFETFNGRNFLDLEIPVQLDEPRPRRERDEDGGDDEPGEGRQRRNRPTITTNAFLGLPDGLRFFKDLLHKDNGAAMVNHSYAKIRDIKYYLGEYDNLSRLPENYWTYENVEKAFLECNTLTEVRQKYGTAYKIACQSNWVIELSSHMTGQKPNGFWTSERLNEAASSVTSRKEFKEKHPAACAKAEKLGLLPEFNVKYWGGTSTKKNHWNFETISEAFKTCNSKTEFQKKYAGAYSAATRLGIWEEISSGVQNKKRAGAFDTLEACIEEAKKYSSSSQWDKNSGASYRVACKNGWLEECKKYFKK